MAESTLDYTQMMVRRRSYTHDTPVVAGPRGQKNRGRTDGDADAHSCTGTTLPIFITLLFLHDDSKIQLKQNQGLN